MRYLLINDGVQIKPLISFPSTYVCASIHDLQSMPFLCLMFFCVRICFILYFRSCLRKKLLAEVALYMLQEKMMVMKCFFPLVVYYIKRSPLIIWLFTVAEHACKITAVGRILWSLCGCRAIPDRCWNWYLLAHYCRQYSFHVSNLAQPWVMHFLLLNCTFQLR